jgi:DNA ligase-1
VPVVVLAYDLLEWQGEDWRNRPQAERRAQLEQVIAHGNNPVLLASPMLTGSDWLISPGSVKPHGDWGSRA